VSQRGHLPRGWFDIALDRPEAECLAKALTGAPGFRRFERAI
jgi:hypothetical protein